MIYVTGDIHGADSIRKLGVKHFPEGATLTRDDYVIILGDFGLVWSEPESGEERWWLDWLEEKPWTTLFIDGNHDNHDKLASMPDLSWKGGRIHEVRPHVYHLIRGEVFTLFDGGRDVKLLAFGGARSHDIEWRTEGVTWWPAEQPSAGDYENAVDNIAANDWPVDYVLTHDAPTATKHALLGLITSDKLSVWDANRWEDDRTNVFLTEIENMLRYRMWYFGHYHADQKVDEKHVALYHAVLPIDAFSG